MKLTLIISLFAVATLYGQNSPKADAAAQAQKKLVTDAASAGTPLPATINVADNVNIEAVMLPKTITNRVFGKDVADNYAVIEVNVSNRSNDAALILQSIFIDLSGWGFAGPMSTGSIAARGLSRRNSKPYQVRGSTREIASVEYRIVRGQLLDAQPWTPRNLTIRTIQVLGSIGTAFAFPFSKDIVAGIGAWNGGVLPGAEVLWPDGMVGQLNRISDYGFRNNKIIPQQSADIVIAFFPIDRFLTPSLRKIFVQSPALFFNPLLLALDPDTRRPLMPILISALGTEDKVKCSLSDLIHLLATQDQAAIDDLQETVEQDQDAVKRDVAAIDKQQAVVEKDRAAVEKDQAEKNQAGLERDQAEADKDHADLVKQQAALAKDQCTLKTDQEALAKLLAPFKANPLYNFLSTLSLNNVHIVLSGIMTVDELTIPSTIASTCFDNAGADMWAIAGDKTCTISGRFLGSGVPKISDADKLGISDITVNKDASTDELLKFTFKLKAPLDPPVEFDIVVVKEGKNGKSVESMKYHVKSEYTLPGAPTITSVTQKDSAVTVTGTNFFSNSKNLFSTSVRPAASKDDKTDVAVKSSAESSTSFTLDTTKFDSAKVGAGCYLVVVKVGTGPSVVSTDKVRVNATPKITGAKKVNSDKAIEVTGTQFVSTKDCGGSEPEFEVLDDKVKVIGSAIPLSKATGNATKITFDLPTVTGTAPKPAAVRIKGSTDTPTKIS